MSLKDDLKQHLDNKNYPAAIALIQGSKLPDAEKTRRVTVLLERMKTEARAEVEVKATVEPVKRRISRLWRVFLVLLVIATAAGVVTTVQRVQQIDAKVLADTAWIGLGAYCSRILFPDIIYDCPVWREWIERDYRAEVIDCNTRHPWLYEDINFYNCLTDNLPIT